MCRQPLTGGQRAIAYIGAAIYFISTSDGSFWGVVLGLLQAIVWPAYVVYHALVLLGA
ncbi:hypothetical protein [Agromyces sp. NPDC049794]|uniref:hypothetical protein n=1 Tax=unclassified Agromyces TaxID=2639701 RepID=UPI0033C44570